MRTLSQSSRAVQRFSPQQNIVADAEHQTDLLGHGDILYRLAVDTGKRLSVPVKSCANSTCGLTGAPLV